MVLQDIAVEHPVAGVIGHERNFDKYLMHTYQASIRAQVQGRSQVIRTEVRAMNAQDAL